MTVKLPRLPLHWRDQPQLFERYWDGLLSSLEKNWGVTDEQGISIVSLNSSVSSLALTVAAIDTRLIAVEAVTIASQSANKFLASPDGAAGVPSYRSIVLADLPTIPVNQGGTGATTPSTARANLGIIGVQSNGFNTISATKTLGSSDKGTNIVITTSGITITFPSSGFANGEGVAISNVSGGAVTLAFPGGSDMGTSLPANGSLITFCDGAGYWRQYCYSTSRL